MHPLTPDLLTLGALQYVVFLLSTTFHEASHAFIAKLGGDPTAFHGGQVTLNPIPHIRREPFGMLVVPLLGILTGGGIIGWASAPYDPMWQLRYQLADELDLKSGTRLEATWWFDNSRHRYNPDPRATVHWGDQTWEEMALVAFDVVVPMNTPSRTSLVNRSSAR